MSTRQRVNFIHNGILRRSDDLVGVDIYCLARSSILTKEYSFVLCLGVFYSICHTASMEYKLHTNQRQTNIL